MSGGTNLGSGTSTVSYSEDLFGVTPFTTYYYCALTSNIYGTGTGTIVFFKTCITQGAMNALIKIKIATTLNALYQTFLLSSSDEGLIYSRY